MISRRRGRPAPTTLADLYIVEILADELEWEHEHDQEAATALAQGADVVSRLAEYFVEFFDFVVTAAPAAALAPMVTTSAVDRALMGGRILKDLPVKILAPLRQTASGIVESTKLRQELQSYVQSLRVCSAQIKSVAQVGPEAEELLHKLHVAFCGPRSELRSKLVQEATAQLIVLERSFAAVLADASLNLHQTLRRLCELSRLVLFWAVCWAVMDASEGQPILAFFPLFFQAVFLDAEEGMPKGPRPQPGTREHGDIVVFAANIKARLRKLEELYLARTESEFSAGTASQRGS